PDLSITSSLLGLGRLWADRVHRGVALRRGLRREGGLVGGGDDGVLAAAGGARLRRVGAVLVALDERGQPRVVGAVELELVVPGGGHDRRRQALERADQHVVALAGGRGHVPQLLKLVGGQVGPVGDPDRAVLQRVDGVLIVDGFVVDVALLPVVVVLPAHRRGLLVRDLVPHVLATVVAGGHDLVHRRLTCLFDQI